MIFCDSFCGQVCQINEKQVFTHARCLTVVQKNIDKDYRLQNNELDLAIPNLVSIGTK